MGGFTYERNKSILGKDYRSTYLGVFGLDQVSSSTLAAPLTFNYDGTVQTWTVPATGTYIIEAYGGAGGDGSNYSSTGAPYTGGPGGYAKGTISLTIGQVLYIVPGAKGLGNYTGSARSFNGGGAPGNNLYPAGQGGGASHVAFTQSGELVNITSSNVIIVGGGGGGGGNCSLGGGGGGTTGVQQPTSTQYANRIAGQGGSQSAGGGPNGFGSYGLGAQNWGQNLAGGGGGGWYGGGGGDNSTGGGGGSGYVNTTYLSNTVLTQSVNVNAGYIVISSP